MSSPLDICLAHITTSYKRIMPSKESCILNKRPIATSLQQRLFMISTSCSPTFFNPAIKFLLTFCISFRPNRVFHRSHSAICCYFLCLVWCLFCFRSVAVNQRITAVNEMVQILCTCSSIRFYGRCHQNTYFFNLFVELSFFYKLAWLFGTALKLITFLSFVFKKVETLFIKWNIHKCYYRGPFLSAIKSSWICNLLL